MAFFPHPDNIIISFEQADDVDESTFSKREPRSYTRIVNISGGKKKGLNSDPFAYAL